MALRVLLEIADFRKILLRWNNWRGYSGSTRFVVAKMYFTKKESLILLCKYDYEH